MENEEPQVAQLATLQKARKLVVLVAIVMLVISLVVKNPIFVYPRAILWFIAAALSVLEAIRLKALGAKPTNAWIRAAIYFVIAFFPLIRSL